ncbi:hypothetical protein AB6A40_000815 [Gnathostoma spinigerum]|uniref:Zinc transporter ZIP1 n=1 Tax=Gnathostoma spinigerum TaxID=75299 RepID=A0ABD6E435_9BILA
MDFDENETTTIPPSPIHPMHNGLTSVLVLALFVLTFGASMLSFAVRHAAERNGGAFTKLFSLLSVFGGGVFLGTCLIDLLPDSIHSIHDAMIKLHISSEFPLPEVLIALGFILVLTIEQLTMYAKEKNWIRSSLVDGHHDMIHDELLADSAVDDHYEGDVQEEDIHFVPTAHSTVRAMLLVLVLSLHAMFEGLSVGMIADVNLLLQVFGALVIHKVVIGFSLGLRLVQSQLGLFTIIVCCAVFSAQVLIGGFFGLAILDLINMRSEAKAALVSGCAQAVACGTFLYITCFEILPHELNQSGYRLTKLLALLIGFILIVVMIAFFPDND